MNLFELFNEDHVDRLCCLVLILKILRIVIIFRSVITHLVGLLPTTHKLPSYPMYETLGTE